MPTYSRHVGEGVYEHLTQKEYQDRVWFEFVFVAVYRLLRFTAPVWTAVLAGYFTYALMNAQAFRTLHAVVVSPVLLAASGLVALGALLLAVQGVPQASQWSPGRRTVFVSATGAVTGIVGVAFLLNGLLPVVAPDAFTNDLPAAVIPAGVVGFAQLIGVAAGVVALLAQAGAARRKRLATTGVLVGATVLITASVVAPLPWPHDGIGLWVPGMVGWAALLLTTTRILRDELPDGALHIGRAAASAAGGGRSAALAVTSQARVLRNRAADRVAEARGSKV